MSATIDDTLTASKRPRAEDTESDAITSSTKRQRINATAFSHPETATESVDDDASTAFNPSNAGGEAPESPLPEPETKLLDISRTEAPSHKISKIPMALGRRIGSLVRVLMGRKSATEPFPDDPTPEQYWGLVDRPPSPALTMTIGDPALEAICDLEKGAVPFCIASFNELNLPSRGGTAWQTLRKMTAASYADGKQASNGLRNVKEDELREAVEKHMQMLSGQRRKLLGLLIKRRTDAEKLIARDKAQRRRQFCQSMGMSEQVLALFDDANVVSDEEDEKPSEGGVVQSKTIAIPTWRSDLFTSFMDFIDTQQSNEIPDQDDGSSPNTLPKKRIRSKPHIGKSRPQGLPFECYDEHHLVLTKIHRLRLPYNKGLGRVLPLNGNFESLMRKT